MPDYLAETFEWDLEKATENAQNHGVSFQEAREVFEGRYRWLPDQLHSEDEERCRAIGFTWRGRMVTVTYCEREPRRRIITAWKSTPHERDAYDEEI